MKQEGTKMPFLSAAALHNVHICIGFLFFQSYERMNLADALVSKSYNDKSVIVNQGAIGDGMYFVEDGSVNIVMEGNDGIERTVSAGIGQSLP